MLRRNIIIAVLVCLLIVVAGAYLKKPVPTEKLVQAIPVEMYVRQNAMVEQHLAISFLQKTHYNICIALTNKEKSPVFISEAKSSLDIAQNFKGPKELILLIREYTYLVKNLNYPISKEYTNRLASSKKLLDTYEQEINQQIMNLSFEIEDKLENI